MGSVRLLGACAVGAMVLGTFGLSDRSVAQDVDPAELVKDIHAIFGEHHARAVHAKGVVLDATFEPTEEARQLSKAAVFAGKVKATIRLSDTTGIPEIPDADPNASPHGLAIKFTLGDGSEMDVVTHSFNGFPAATAADFDMFLKAVAASGPGATKPTPIEKYLEAHPNAVPFVTKQNPPPESLATTTYFGVNAFAFVDDSGKRSIVRYRFVPEAGDRYLDAAAAAAKGPNYLMDEIAERVAKGPVAFDWFAQIAQAGDKADDPSTPWPEDRQLIKLGKLEITAKAADQEGLNKSLLFLPNNVPDGIEVADPMIEVRSAAYPISFGERQ
ncbi:catalase family peroxidase [Mesorhizobium sp. BAC0120]|uniref:catalase family peroxidase n=1 Tax=Mesorhizobium sp. BAC0120 TaxID=3090670 RepID=UPI00298D0DB2|nr:catalase family peroxidase [Mesorhizobium sp. BAC0120]MDW6020397.1 catalase family peroxidase [Mesorhizobium sp. BAC0120]